MSCGYEYYDEDENYYPRLRCKLNNGSYCLYSKKCEKVQKFVPIEGELWKECYLYNMEKAKNVPKGSYFIQSYRPNKKGKLYLYVVMDDKVQKVLSDLEEINQDYVYLKETLDGYIVSTVPFQDKKVYQRKPKAEDK